MVYTSAKWFGVRGAWKNFMTRRLIRIVPIYWFYMSVLVIVALIMPQVLETVRLEPLHLLLSYLFIPHQNPTGGLHPFLDLGWTLNYEMYFYAIFAALLFLPMRKMLWALSAFFAAAVIAGLYIPFEMHTAYFWTRPIMLGFLGGAWVGYAFLYGVRLSSQTMILIPAFVMAMFAIPFCKPELQPWLMPAFAVAITALTILPARMEKLAVPGWLVRFGDASYTVYLSHPFVLAAFALLGHKILPPLGVFAASIPAALIGGYILYLIIEKPLISAGKRVFLSHEKAF
jgi:exopolysaccharide production protein ExoZ